MIFRLRFVTFSFVIFLLISCGKTDRVDTKEVKEALKGREIKRISPAQILEVVEIEGKTDSKTFVNCSNQKNTTDYLNCFPQERKQLIDQLKFFPLHDSSGLSELEKNLTDAYNSAFDGNEELHVNVQDLNNGKMLFTQPVFYSDTSKIISTSPSGFSDKYSFGIIFIYYLKKEIILSIP